MGKGLLIIVLGLSTIIGSLILNINENSKKGLSSTIEYYEQTQARLIANSGIEIFLEKLRRNKNLTGQFQNNSLFNGNFDVSISGPDSNLTIKSIANYNGVIHRSIAKANRMPVTLPNINGSLYVASSSTSIHLNGNIVLDGNDTNLDGTPGPNPPIPGVSVDDPADSAYWVNNIKPGIVNDIKGLGGTPSIRTVPNTTDWTTLTENFIFANDITLNSGNYSTGTILGTVANPKITYVNGNVSFSGNSSGAGIMVINGNVNMSGNFTYKGILICYGQSTITTQITGNGGIYGGTIFVGTSVNIHSTGNSSFYYSSQAINLAKNNLKSSRFSIKSWWE